MVSGGSGASDSACCIHTSVEFFKGFSDKGELYKHLNEHCKPLDVSALGDVISVTKLRVSEALEKLDGAAQVIVVAKSGDTAIPLAVVVNCKSKVFHVLIDTLTNCPDIDCALKALTTYITRVLDVEKLYELKLQYNWGGASITIKSRCLFNERVLEAILLNAIFLALFISSSHTLRL